MTRPKKLLSAVALVLLLSSSLIATSAPEASAISSFDQELLRLVNEHRRSVGLPNYVESAALSQGSLSWSQTMRNNSSGFCGNQGYRHHPNPGAAENIAWSCGPAGIPLNPSRPFTYGGLPGKCRGALDHASALMMFCSWVDSAPHRAAIESRTYVSMGAGTSSYDNGGNRATFSTMRFHWSAGTPTNVASRVPRHRRNG